MIFKKALEEKKESAKSLKKLLDIKNNKIKPIEHVLTTNKSTTIKDPDKYPKENMFAWDPGISDRGPSGFPSDINVLKHREVIGKNNKNFKKN